MSCKNLHFALWKNSLKSKILWFFESRHHHLLESIAKIAHFYILTLPGGSLWRKIIKNHFSKGCGDKKGHNSIDKRASALKLLSFIENKSLVKIKTKRDTRLQKNRAELESMGTNECSQSAFKSSWDSQDFGDVRMVLNWSIFSSPPCHNELMHVYTSTICIPHSMGHLV